MQNQATPPLNVTFHPAASVMQYSNVVFVNNSSEEFIMDYGIGAPGREGVEIFSRIALSSQKQGKSKVKSPLNGTLKIEISVPFNREENGNRTKVR